MRKWRAFRITRDGVIFLSGLGILLHETLIYRGTERPQLLIIAAMMIGLPAFLRKDEAAQKKEDAKPPSETSGG